MSYNNDIYGLSTLAHELGHSMHSYYTWETQPPVYSDYSIFVAEVASNFDQALVRDYLLKNNPDPQFQIALIEEAMSNYHRYFFIMPTLARFELEIHERVERGEALTAESLMELMTELFREGYGENVVVDAPRVGITWAEFPTHLYANFYVYQYATGISGAHALAEGFWRENPARRRTT
jgi:oligoendopeptidase F